MPSASHRSARDDSQLKFAIQQSRTAFIGAVWPIWAKQMGAREILSTEDSERTLEATADFSGTDAFFMHDRGVLIPIASRIEYFDADRNNPFKQKYWDHYPRFTVRLAKSNPDGSISTNVECRKRLLALEDPISRRYLPLYTFQSLMRFSEQGTQIIQTSRVRTEELFSFVRDRMLYDLAKGTVSKTYSEGDVYRLITAEKLKRAGIEVVTKDFRTQLIQHDQYLESFVTQER